MDKQSHEDEDGGRILYQADLMYQPLVDVHDDTQNEHVL